MAVTKFGYQYLELCEFSVYATNKEPLPWEKNVALGKRTWQIDTTSSGASSRAVDGNTNGHWNQNSCTHTNTGPNRWWMVDLGKEEKLTRVRLYNRLGSYLYCKKCIFYSDLL